MKFKSVQNNALLSRVGATMLVVAIAATAYAAPGDLDPTFGNGGIIAYRDPTERLPQRFIIQPDGKILAVLYDWYVDELGVRRFTSDGLLDNTFGINRLSVWGHSRGYEMEPDGKLLGIEGTQVSRYSADGILLSVLVEQPIDFSDLIRQSDGKIVTLGNLWKEFDFVVSRFHPDGSPDLQFGVDGHVKDESDTAYRILGQPDGSFIVERGCCVLKKLNPDGRWDSKFGKGGFVTVFGDIKHIQPDGKILLAEDQSGSTPAGITRLTRSGALDRTFGVDGRVSLPESANDVTVDPDGNIVVAMPNGIFRLTSAGVPDITFGINGYVWVPIPRSYWTSAEVLDNKKILLGGICDCPENSMVFARLIGNSESSPTFRLSGRVLTTAGRGLSGVRVTVDNGAGNSPSTSTNSLGYFSFENLPPGSYGLSAQSRRYRFPTQTMSITSSLTNIEIVALE